jgi:hypothetical protein
MGDSPYSAESVITLYYYERPPCTIVQSDGVVAGILGRRAAYAFDAAGIPFIWKQMPAMRQLSEIKQNNEPACALGWYKIGDRASYATFTHAIYRDRGIVAIVRKDFPTLKGGTLSQYLADKKLRVLVKLGLSYGPIVASQIATGHAQIIVVTAEQPQLTRMITSGRADMMFSTIEEAETLLTENESGESALKKIDFPDFYNKENDSALRYIMCNKRVSAEFINKLNVYIDEFDLINYN